MSTDPQPRTRQDAADLVRRVIENSRLELGEERYEYDLDAILAELHDIVGSWDFTDDLPDETFWEVVEKHSRPAPAWSATSPPA